MHPDKVIVVIIKASSRVLILFMFVESVNELIASKGLDRIVSLIPILVRIQIHTLEATAANSAM